MAQTENNVIKIFGDQAKSIDEGDQFIARVKFVEGRKIIELEPHFGAGFVGSAFLEAGKN